VIRLIVFFAVFLPIASCQSTDTDADEMLQFITGLSKAEVHLHLEGSLGPQTVVDLATRNGIDSFKSVEEVEASLASREPGLIGFLTHYNNALKVLQTQEDFYQATYDLLATSSDNGTVYVELSFDPQEHTSRGILFDAVINGIDEGRQAAAKEFGIETNLIMAINRNRSVESAFEMLELAVPHQEKLLGLGLDSGPEDGNPPSKFEAVYARAREEGYHLTAHCDVHQLNSVQHIWESIDLLHVDRIDHGLNSIEDPRLVAELKRRNICLAGSPVQRSSDPEPQDLDIIRELFDAGVCVGLHTDDPAQFDSGHAVNLLFNVQQAAGYSKADMVQFIINAFESSFLSRSDKDSYIESLMAYAAAHEVVM
jgi:adenosine deaminase